MSEILLTGDIKLRHSRYCQDTKQAQFHNYGDNIVEAVVNGWWLLSVKALERHSMVIGYELSIAEMDQAADIADVGTHIDSAEKHCLYYETLGEVMTVLGENIAWYANKAPAWCRRLACLNPL